MNLNLLNNNTNFFYFFNASLVLLYFTYFPLCADVNYLMFSASKVLDGFEMYREVDEINPPLIIILSMVPVYVSDLLHFELKYMMLFFIFFLIYISYRMSKKIMSSSKIENNTQTFLLFSIITILMIVPMREFGEREHLSVIFILPYILMMMFKNRVSLSRNFIIFIALFAAVGFNLKPYFFLIFFFIELAYFTQTKKITSLFRLETVIISLSLFIYVAGIYLLFPAFFEVALPRALAYKDVIFKVDVLKLLSMHLDVYLGFFTIILTLIYMKKESLDLKVLLALLSATLLIYLYQQKGWHYHILPYFMYSLLGLSYLFFVYMKHEHKIYMLVLFPMLISILAENHYRNEYPQLNSILKKLDAYSKIIIVTSDIGQSQPLLVPNHQLWSAYSPTVSMLDVAIKKDDNALKDRIIQRVFQDINSSKPKYVIFPNFENNFQYYDYFRERNRELEKYLEKYYELNNDGNYQIFTRIEQ